MCGIVGYVSSENMADDKLWIDKALTEMSHRGPDGRGEYHSSDGRVSLGHCRLAIFDVTQAGAQPMSSKKHKVSITFNGEIYNFVELRAELTDLGYEFKSNSDTEVVLLSYAHWGEQCLKKLSGMFAFAIHDYEANSLFLARDRAGEKPLYYCDDANFFIFASEIKALLQNKNIRRKIDHSAFQCYLSFGFAPSPISIISKVAKVAPGSYLKYDLDAGELTIKTYWEIPASSKRIGKSKKVSGNLYAEFSELFDKAIKMQLKADVPLGVLLSGGLDSSLVTAFTSRARKKIKTFNVRFPGNKEFDETKHARIIANYFETDHHELDADDTDPELLIDLAKQFDEPIIDSSMVPTFLVTREVRKYCTVALGGDGADELFGGYSHYGRLIRLQRLLKFIPFPIQKTLGLSIKKILPADTKYSNWVHSLNYNYQKEVPLVAHYFDEDRHNNLLKNSQFNSYSISEKIYRQKCVPDENFLERLLKTDFKLYLAEDILVKSDRASMLNSLELRSPFLDHRIIEFAFNHVPNNLKVHKNHKKVFLNSFAKTVLPETFAFGRKQGFSIPLDKWLQSGPFRDFFHDVLFSKDCLFDRKAMMKLLSDNIKGFDNSEKIFGLVMFELWRKIYRVQL
jgi:asparagine synthase (glutamine-hydrolysing)